MSEPSKPLKERIVVRAFELGFDVVGVARADEPLGLEHDRFLELVERGMHGAMRYLADHGVARKRLDTDEILEGAKSIICVGRRYGRDAESEAKDAKLARSIARYARGQDYHNYVRKRVQRL